MPISIQLSNPTLNSAATPNAGAFLPTSEHLTALSAPDKLGVFLESEGNALQLKDSFSFALMFAVVVVGLVAIRRLAARMRGGHSRLLE